jgi:NAD(P)-dependent dehydrogenase (short-subunit alcohol dehydrogenase family)
VATRLEGKVALVTGAGGGLGGAIARRFAQEGAVVVVNDVDLESAVTVAEACQEWSADSVAVASDVSESASVSALFDEIAQRFGRVDVLATIAGISATSQLGESTGNWKEFNAPYATSATALSDEHWRQMLGVHLDGTFFCIRAALPLMSRGGSIVCMSSMAGLNGMGPFHYAAAKGGILGLVRALARDLGPEGIRINAVCPGGIAAGMSLHYDQDFLDTVIPHIPMRRFGEALDIANAALHLASDESAYTTGQWLSPNGGLVIG